MIDSIIDVTLLTSRISSPIAGRADSGGGVESGKAVIWKSVQTWTAVQKRQGYWTSFFKTFFLFAIVIYNTYTY